jgi:hypothetical protein
MNCDPPNIIDSHDSSSRLGESGDGGDGRMLWCVLYASQATHEPDATVMEQLVQVRVPGCLHPVVLLHLSRPVLRASEAKPKFGNILRDNYDRLSPDVIKESDR